MTKYLTFIVTLLCVATIHNTNAMNKPVKKRITLFIAWQKPIKKEENDIAMLIKKFNQHPLNKSKKANLFPLLFPIKPNQSRSKKRDNYLRKFLPYNTQPNKAFKPLPRNNKKSGIK
jgi:hypothetical protein